MYYASDFRARAREALRGKWGAAILTCFVASLLGITHVLTGFGSGGGASISLPIDDSYSDIYPSYGYFDSEEFMALLTIVLIAMGIGLVIGIAFSVLRAPLQLGYARFNLNLVDGNDARLGDLFSQFRRTGSAFVMNFLVGLFTFLWSMLFVIPGIIKTYSYSMTSFVMLDHPGLSASEAITQSRRLMDGNKWRLFCLNFSFIGWELLITVPFTLSLLFTVITAVIYSETADQGTLVMLIIAMIFLLICIIAIPVGQLFLIPYQNAAFAAFYRRITEEKSALMQGQPQYYPNAQVQPQYYPNAQVQPQYNPNQYSANPPAGYPNQYPAGYANTYQNPQYQNNSYQNPPQTPPANYPPNYSNTPPANYPPTTPIIPSTDPNHRPQ